MKKKLAAVAMATMMIMGTVNVQANAIVSEDVVNVRTGNDTCFDTIGQLPYGQDVNVLEWDVGNGWALAETPYGTGFIFNALLSYDGTGMAYAVASQHGSATERLIVVDTGLMPRVYVFIAGNGWELERVMECSVGAPGSPTPVGVFALEGKRATMYSGATNEYYVSDFAYDTNGEAWAFHSTLYEAGTYNLVDGRTGMHISNGCIRLNVEDAEWIWRVCGVGTGVVVI